MIRKRVTNIRYNCTIAMSTEYQLNEFVRTWPITITNNDNEEHRMRLPGFIFLTRQI